jgi:hypothetical protein
MARANGGLAASPYAHGWFQQGGGPGDREVIPTDLALGLLVDGRVGPRPRPDHFVDQTGKYARGVWRLHMPATESAITPCDEWLMC